MIDFDSIVNGAITDVFGESLAYTSKTTGTTTTIQAPFSDPFKHQVLMDDGSPAWTESTVYFGCSLALLPSPPVKGDSVTRTATGLSYLVYDSVPDGLGWTRIFLKELA